jgi:hypothetical protein
MRFHTTVPVFTALVIAMSMALTGCEETCPLDSTGPVDTTTTVQQKNVVLEEMTGVRCVNCPEAHELAKQIYDDHPGRVELVSIHTGFYAVPYSFGTQDLKLAQGSAIETYIGGGPISYPIGSVDRYLLSGQANLLLDKSFWPGAVTDRLDDTLKVEIGLDNNYNASTRKLDIAVNLKYLYDIGNAQRITLYITESDIVEPQLTPAGIDTFYVHRNVARAVLTAAEGDDITETTTAGTELQRSYSFTLPNNWVAGNCRVIALVGKNTVDSKEVLQVVGEPVQ